MFFFLFRIMQALTFSFIHCSIGDFRIDCRTSFKTFYNVPSKRFVL